MGRLIEAKLDKFKVCCVNEAASFIQKVNLGSLGNAVLIFATYHWIDFPWMVPHVTIFSSASVLVVLATMRHFFLINPPEKLVSMARTLLREA